eukprot:15341919-Ditylum_brightwellii.AAC.1
MHVKKDNKTPNSFVNVSIRIKHSKSWDMRWHWLWKTSTRKVLEISWDKGSNNNADNFSNHHPSTYHRVQHKHYILKGFFATQ